MLQKMRGRAANFIAKILGLLLIVSFGAWGIADYIRPAGAPTKVADVGDQSIGVNEFNERYRREVSRLSSMLGTQLDPDQARRFGLAETTLDQMISLRLIGLEVGKLGLLVGDQEVRRSIYDQRAFHNTLGQFDRMQFRRVLADNGLTEDRYVEVLRSDLARDHLTGIIQASATAPKRLTDDLYRYRAEKRVADVVQVARAAPDSISDPDEATLAEFHKTHSAQFMALELRDLTLVYLDPNEIAGQMKPTEQRLQDEFERRRSTFEVPERRTIRQLVSGDEEIAKKSYEALKQGGDFAATAKDIAGRPEESTRLGTVTRRDLPNELADAAFALALNVPSEPVKSPLGWHVLLIEKIEPGKTHTLEELKPQLTREVAREMAVDQIVSSANKLEDALAGGSALESIGGQFGAKVLKIEGMDATGRGKDAAPKDGIPRTRKFFEVAFTTGAKETSLLSDTGDGGLFVLRIDAITPSALRPLTEIRPQVVAAWKRAQLDEAARVKATAIRDKVRGGETLSAAATAEKLEVKASKPFTRAEIAPDSIVPQGMVGELFKLAKGGVESGPTETGYAVAQVTEITPADPEADKTGAAQLASQVREGLVADLMAGYTAALRGQYSVSIYQRALDRFYTDARN
jgi:peptidyl-prolyl cis-trans isomerase D